IVAVTAAVFSWCRVGFTTMYNGVARARPGLSLSSSRFAGNRISMHLFAFGINHHTASVDIREKVDFSPEEMPAALNAALEAMALEEIAILSTCTRTEIYGSSRGQAVDPCHWLAIYKRLSPELLAGCAYCHSDDQAIQHMMRVACGLDSLVLGEPQILGQVKSAYAVARDSGTLGTFLNQAFQHSFSTAKKVRTETA